MTPQPKNIDRVTFRLPRSTMVKLEARCAEEDRPRSWIVRRLVEKGLAVKAKRAKPAP